MQNIDFKAELRDHTLARSQCKAIGASCIGTLRQVDTYFKLADGRLKRRESNDEPVEWIYYHRPDRIKPCLCNYTILSDEQAKLRWGTHSLKEWLTVVKIRELWMIDNVRIHIDQVVRLGRFIEFEAMVTKENDVMECHLELAELRETFALLMGEPISASYSDLMDQLLAEKK
ncbi:MAG: class IV adenylate cyclase [Planctomycetota bacterium]|nr:class IV adenylate cyclase [Planctomycetota bacterium]